MTIPTELRGSFYEQGRLIYSGQLGVAPETQTLIEAAFEQYRAELDAATETTISAMTTRRSTSNKSTTPNSNISTAGARTLVSNLIAGEPGLSKSQIIQRMAAMLVPTRVGVIVRTLYNEGLISAPDLKNGPFFPSPAARSTTTANDRRGDTEATRSMQAGSTDIEV